MKGDFSNNKIIFTLFVSIFFSAISDYSIYIYIFFLIQRIMNFRENM